MADHIPDHLSHLIQTTNEFNGIPDAHELLRDGGMPGVEYALVAGQNVGYWTSPEGGDWQLTKGAGVYTLIGPLAALNSVLLLCKGTPIEGAAPDSGPRKWWIDADILEATGLQLVEPEAEADVA